MGFTDKEKAKAYYKQWRESERGKNYTKEYAKTYYQKIRGTPEARRAFHMKQRFGLTMEEYAKMLHSQNYVCGICFKKQVAGKNLNGTLAVDHDHKTGKIRGLLCQKCNTALGMFNDEIELFNNAIKWIQTHEQ